MIEYIRLQAHLNINGGQGQGAVWPRNCRLDSRRLAAVSLPLREYESVAPDAEVYGVSLYADPIFGVVLMLWNVSSPLAVYDELSLSGVA